MLHLGLLTPAFTGHLRPMAVLGRELARRGHRVRILSIPDGLSQMGGSGLELSSFGEKAFPDGGWDRRTAALGAAEGKEIFRIVFRLILDQTCCLASELPPLLNRLKLDGLIVDQLCYGAESVAEALGVPMVMACNALPFHRESRVPLCFRHWNYNPALWARARNRLEGAISLLEGWRLSLFYLRHRKSLGLGPPKLSHINELPPSLAQVAQIPEFFDFPRRNLPDHFHYTGPWLEATSEQPGDFPWERLDERPLIYASLGTLQNRVMRWHEMIAEACAGLDVQLVIGLGRTSNDLIELAPNLSNRAIVARFAPQRALISRAALVITHAGLNSTLETLSAGAPIVAIPISHDQPGVAARLHRLGVARVLPAEKLTAARLRSEISLVTNTPSFRAQARECANLLRASIGPELAADIIEEAFHTRQRVRRPLLNGTFAR
jgi:zeaxanthin glucosyltransferase